MKIHGLQKMTLLDFPGYVACTIFTPGCNFRCPFCHNALLVNKIEDENAYSVDEVLAFLKSRRGLLDGVAITGGEPMLQNGLEDFIRQVRLLGFKIKLDTNGSFPEKLEHFINEGLLDYVAMDIKNSKEKYAVTADNDAVLQNVEKSVALLLKNKVDYEFRTTVVASLHTAEDIEKICLWIKGAKKYFIQPFVNSGELVCDSGFEAPNAEILKNMESVAQKYIKAAVLRGTE